MGILYLVSTPIGNLEDITLRALRILKEVDLVLCEDTRQTRKLLNHFQIHRPLESFNEYNEPLKLAKVINLLEAGKSIALVSDGGTPEISDPGFRLVRQVISGGLPLVPVPGPSAVTSALSVSGLPTDRFTFVGFLPQKEGKRKNFLEELKAWEGTVVAFESPNRLIFALRSIHDVFGDIHICVAREITKIHEDFFRGKVSGAIEHFEKGVVKGEVTLVLHK